MTFIVTPQTNIGLSRVSLTLAEIQLLETVCVSGLPLVIDEPLRDAITVLICKSINPMRPLPEVTE